jgi:hypothetical protein
MTVTGPRPPSVVFDHGAAATAVAALDRATAVLVDVGEGRRTAGAVARARFRGTYAADFQGADAALGREAGTARSALAALRRAIAAAAETALQAQALRQREQQAWDRADRRRPPPGVA